MRVTNLTEQVIEIIHTFQTNFRDAQWLDLNLSGSGFMFLVSQLAFENNTKLLKRQQVSIFRIM